MDMRNSFQSFNNDVPIKDRVAIVGPIINDLIGTYFDGTLKEGVETFQHKLVERIESAGLLDKGVWIDVDKAGVHPDNREGAGLVPMDVQDLLQIFTLKGWVWNKVEALAARIPHTPEGQRWRTFNVELARGSDGLLADTNPDNLEVVTARGSHTTSAVRCMKHATRGVHDECCIDGVISKSKIIERQPSLAEPCDKGLPYDVVKPELVEACPQLMQALARTGNASHGVHRVETVLQGAKRLHQTIMSVSDPLLKKNKDHIVKLACVGQLPEYQVVASSLYEFARNLSGGKNMHILTNLEAYERTLQVKRILCPHDLGKIAAIKLPEAHRYAPAMIKCMLNAPSEYVSKGTAELFNTSDIVSLGENGKNRPYAIEAHGIMVAATNFMKAYSRLDNLAIDKLVSDLEVRCCMHVHLKKSQSRKQFKSLLHVAEHLYLEAKKCDNLLPTWPLLASLAREQDTSTHADDDALKEISRDGSIPDSQMQSNGFVVGAKVTRKADKNCEPDDATVYKVTSLADVATVQLQLQTGDDEGNEEQTIKEVTRAEMLTRWMVQVEEPLEACSISISDRTA